MEYNSHVYAGALTLILRLLRFVQECAKLFVNDGKVSNSIGLLKHGCILACVLLFYRY